MNDTKQNDRNDEQMVSAEEATETTSLASHELADDELDGVAGGVLIAFLIPAVQKVR